MTSKRSILNAQRTYNKWVANETLEDFALRYTAKRARRWSDQRVANTALGIVSFLALEAIGGAITLNYGFTNAFWAISVVSIIIFFSGLPICYHAAKTGVDIDLLTRGAGFGYIGSTISSLIYASFTFIFFALEAAIMSMALQVLFGIPLALAYIISALVVIPLVTHGISRISIFQLWTQPIWLILQFLPLAVIIANHQSSLDTWMHYPGTAGHTPAFNLYLFGAAAAVIFPLMAQNGEQVDFLRFLPKQHEGSRKWWASLIIAGPGWVFVGFIKLLVGSFLAILALQHGVELDLADDPTHMYMVAFSYITHHEDIALVLAGVFVIISQLKINVTNAYAGSIAWSNFFSRVTHNHPGRVVWLFFNVCIALLLMELGLYHAFESILITYSALVLSWLGSLVADLTINLWLGLRPKEIQFKRSHLYDINPVGVVSMILASALGIAGQLGAFTPTIKAISPFIALFLPFITVPLLAWLTRSRYYLIRPEGEVLAEEFLDQDQQACCAICENHFDREDMSFCPFYSGPICSLCCALDSRCRDECRPEGNLKSQTFQFLGRIVPQPLLQQLNSKVGYFLVILTFISIVTAILFSLVFFTSHFPQDETREIVFHALWKLFFLLLIINGVIIWLYVLAENSKKKAFEESRLQMLLLQDEIIAHKKTENALQEAKEKADTANLAKSRYLSGVSHELRTPLNTVYGYAQLIERDENLPPKVRNAAKVIGKSGEHITDIIEGLLEISKIEARRVDFLHKQHIKVSSLINPLVESFTMQAEEKGIQFHFHCERELPTFVATDAKRIRQILMNLLSNAIKFTQQGSVTLSIAYRNDVAKFTISDTGIGITEENQKRIFEPFERVQNNETLSILGTGLGLAISRLLADLLGGDISLESAPGKGSTFVFSVLLPAVSSPDFQAPIRREIIGYKGERKNILVVDDEVYHRSLVNEFLTPLGFNIFEACNAQKALQAINEMTFDLFLLDVSMPEENGWSLAQKIANLGLQAPVIMISGNAIEDQKDQMNSRLYDYYIIKPVSFDDLLDKVGSALNIDWLFDDEAKPLQAAATHISATITLPEDDHLQPLLQAASIGHIKGVEDVLQQLKQQGKSYDAFVQKVEALLQNYDLQAIKAFIEEQQ